MDQTQRTKEVGGLLPFPDSILDWESPRFPCHATNEVVSGRIQHCHSLTRHRAEMGGSVALLVVPFSEPGGYGDAAFGEAGPAVVGVCGCRAPTPAHKSARFFTLALSSCTVLFSTSTREFKSSMRSSSAL